MEKYNSPIYMCSLCRGKFQFENIRYSKDGKNIVCVTCYSSFPKRDNNKSKKYIAVYPKSENIKLVCLDCNYHFSLKKKSRVHIRCPYCSGIRLTKDDITADELLEEVSNLKNII